MAKLRLPIRYRAGGTIDKDSFLREKVFHLEKSDQFDKRLATVQTTRQNWENYHLN
jgi:hypothetical protein